MKRIKSQGQGASLISMDLPFLAPSVIGMPHDMMPMMTLPFRAGINHDMNRQLLRIIHQNFSTMRMNKPLSQLPHEPEIMSLSASSSTKLIVVDVLGMLPKLIQPQLSFFAMLLLNNCPAPCGIVKNKPWHHPQ
jgi:hypothetical protein